MTKATMGSRDLTPTLITRHFNPAWFASVMGTAVLPLALSFTGADWTDGAARIFIPLAGVMFLAFLVPWSLKMLLHRKDSAKDFNHPVASSFLPTMPIALLIFALDLLKFGHLFMAAETAQILAFWLWVSGSVGIYLLGFAVLAHVFRSRDIQLEHANFGWLIPPVSKLLIPVAGFELAGHLPQYREVLLSLSLASLGIGLFLFLFVAAAAFQRYLFRGLPPQKFAPTFFIGIAPPAILAVALAKLSHYIGHHELLGLTAENFTPLANLVIMMTWGLAAWWFVMGLVLVVYTWLKEGLPFALSWWAFTFPTGALAISSGIAWQISQFSALRVFYNAVMFFLLVIWLVAFVRTAAGVISRRLLLPAH
jgi:C4-dicarboxylate transporter/malic acid transport protein